MLIAMVIAMALAATSCDDPGPFGSPVCRRGSPRITVFQGPDGECIARSLVVGYRCDDADPLVVLDAGSDAERRFLGGAFAVPVSTLPENAQVIGVGDGAQLVTVARGQRWLYTVRGSAIWRWLALPQASEIATETPTAFMVGDSLLDGGSTAIVAALPDWKVEIDAEPGRASSSGAAIAEGRGRQDQVVVIELGTNDRFPDSFATNAARIVSGLREVPLVLWHNVQGPPDVVPAEEINAAIGSLAGHRPNVAIADWDDAVPEEFLHDGVHPDAAHLDAMASLIAPMLQRWRTAATGQPSCDQ